MSNGHGGLRVPEHPAPASGPGKLSRRTDGGPAQKLRAPTGMPYGDQKALLAQERTAPMAATPGTPSPSGDVASQPTPAAYNGVPFGAPTQRPNEVITHGVDIGAGAGSNILPVEHQPQYAVAGPITRMLSQLSASDATGALGSMLNFARAKGV